MLMKVFNKGQVVIPAAMRKQLDLHVGDLLEVQVDADRACIELKKAESKTGELAGSLAAYAKQKPFPTRKQMHEAFAKGLGHEA